jgi:2-polyprenyl-3-methyl-5-hydroxy-6-metoxy-1,4-benzoquinol methylase
MTAPRPSVPPDAVRAEYDRQYRLWLTRQGPRALDLEWRMAHLLWRHRAVLRRFPPRGKRVLDFGCMDGVFTLKLQALGADAVGYDISPAAIAQAERFRAPAVRPTFTTVAPVDRRFDLVYCQEVIEHVEDDSSLAGELVRYLAPGGSLVGSTPVGRYFWDPDHKRAYDEISLRRCLAPWGRVRLWRCYRSPLRNLVPLRQAGAAVFIFQVTPSGEVPGSVAVARDGA